MQKPEIQYVGQFYVHGSAAKKVAVKPQKEEKEYSIPLHRFEKIRKVYVDPVAIAGIVLAMVFLVCMVAGTLQMQNAWQELNTAKQYLHHVENIHTERLATYHSGYNLKEVREAALQMGMIPVSEAVHMTVTVTMPEPEVEPTLWEEIVWFAKGLFA